jgi:hypothetical protein
LRAAVGANCLATQSSAAYWEFADYVHANQDHINSLRQLDGQFTELDRLTVLRGQTQLLDMKKLESCIEAQNEDAIKASVQKGEALATFRRKNKTL